MQNYFTGQSLQKMVNLGQKMVILGQAMHAPKTAGACLCARKLYRGTPKWIRSSFFYLADVLVQSPRKFYVFGIKEYIYWMKGSREQVGMILITISLIRTGLGSSVAVLAETSLRSP